MMDESAKAFIDTKFEHTWMVYHDALTLMRAKECKEWMESEGYLKRWILPSPDLYSGYSHLEKKNRRTSTRQFTRV